MTLDLATIEELAISSARQRAERQVSYEVTGELSAEDLKEVGQKKLPTVITGYARLRHTHHLLARMMAEDKPLEEISLITGYSPSRISLLRGSPAFAELIAYYQAQSSAVELEIRSRITALGVDFMDELQNRLEEKPDTFTNAALLESATALLDRGLAPKGQQQSGGRSLTIEFITPEGTAGAKIVDISPKKSS